MDKLLIKAPFRVFVHESEDKPSKRVEFLPGMVISTADVPADQDAQDWIDKGLAEFAKPAEQP